MTTPPQIDDCLMQAIKTIENYIEKTTGKAPCQQEIANALTRFFVLKEIGEFIEMDRLENKKSN